MWLVSCSAGRMAFTHTGLVSGDVVRYVAEDLDVSVQK